MIIVLKLKYLIALAQAANLGQSCSQLVLDPAPAAWRDLQTGILQSDQRGKGKGAKGQRTLKRCTLETIFTGKKDFFVYFKQ